MNKNFYYDKTKRYVIGVSGGPDSMALLNMLYEKGYELIVCLVNYNTRKESNDEQLMVKKYCLDRKICFQTIDVLYYKKYGNFEASARDIRYKFFAENVIKYNAEGVFVAHHQDDLLETYLLQKQRRIITKYFGLKEETMILNVKIFRPLLDVSKKELIDYCESHKIDYSIDSTNLENEHLRNKIRNTIVSKYSMEERNKMLKKIELENVKRQENLKRVNSLLNYEKISIEEFNKLSEIEKQLLVYQLIRDKVEENINLTYYRINEMIKLLHSNKPNVCHKIYGLYYFIREYNFFYIGKLEKETAYCYYMNEPSLLDVKEFSCDFRCDTSFLKIYDYSYPLMFRNAKMDDVVLIGEINKKVNRILIDEKVPLKKRCKYPVVVDKNGKIVYIPLYRSEIQKKIANKLKFVLK